jgi:hypothetical protein
MLILAGAVSRLTASAFYGRRLNRWPFLDFLAKGSNSIICIIRRLNQSLGIFENVVVFFR